MQSLMSLAIIVQMKDQFSSSFRHLAQMTRMSKQQLMGLGDQFNAVGLRATVMGGTVVAGFGAALRTAEEFEYKMSAVKAISGATASEFAKMREQAIKLGADSFFSASQAAEGQKYLAQAGFGVNEVLAAMPGLLSVAKAGEMDLGRTAEVTSDILRAFGMQAGDMGHLGDVLAKTINTSSTGMQDLAFAMQYAASDAHIAGASLAEVAGMMGIMGNEGKKGSEAGTTLRQIFLRLAGPGKKASEQLEEFGVLTKDAHGNLRNMVDILTDLQNVMSKLGTGDYLEAVRRMFGVEASSGAVMLLKKAGSGELQKYISELKDSTGQADQVAGVMGNNLKGDMEQLKGAFETLAIVIGDTLVPALRPVVDGLTTLVQWAGAFAKNHPIIAGAFIRIALAMGIGTVVAGMLALALGAAATALTVLSAPVVGAVAAVSMLVAGLMLLVLWWDDVTGAIVTAAGWFRGVPGWMQVAMAALLPIVGLPLMIISHWTEIKTFFASLGGFVGNLFDWIGAKAAWLGEKLGFLLAPVRAMKGFFAAVGGGLFDAGDAAKGRASAGKIFGLKDDGLAAELNKPTQTQPSGAGATTNNRTTQVHVQTMNVRTENPDAWMSTIEQQMGVAGG